MPQKCCFRQKKLALLGKKCGFLVMVAPNPLIICLKTLENTHFCESSTLKIGYGALYLTNQAPKTLF